MAIARKAGQPSESLRQACATVVEPLRARSEEVAQAIYTRIHEAVPDAASGEDPGYRQGVKRAIEALLQHTFDGLIQDPGRPRAAPPAAALAQARRAAQAGVGVGTVLRRYLAGHEHLGELIADAAESSGQDGREQVLRQVRATQAELVGELMEAIEREYHCERERIAPSPQRRRGETARRLLAGEHADPAEIAELGYDINGRWHVGAVLTGEHADLLAAHWPIGRLAVSGLQRIGVARKLVKGKPQGACDPVGDVPCGIGDAALDPADGGGVEIGGVG